MHKAGITSGLFMAVLTVALVGGTPRVARSQDADLVKKGQVTASLWTTRHSWS